MLRMLRLQRVDIRQLELTEFKARRHRTAGQREARRVGAFRGKPQAGRYDRLKYGIRMRQRVAQPLGHQRARFVHCYRKIACLTFHILRNVRCTNIYS